jgi:NADPH-dependent 2,4-dienoyl-CoA reductase/sulfur reductase-like enzyme
VGRAPQAPQTHRSHPRDQAGHDVVTALKGLPRQPVRLVGPGAIGGLLAARLSKAGHNVTVIATDPTAVASYQSPRELSATILELEGLAALLRRGYL